MPKTTPDEACAWERFERIDIEGAARELAGVVTRTPLLAHRTDDARVELRLKLENRQETGAFKARGAWNQLRQLDPDERARGVVACSSGNHGRALSWAARRAGVAATIVMPHDAYPNKIEACRELGAEVVLAPSRERAEEIVAERVEAGTVEVHPYDAERTIAGAGTVGLEIAEDWPEVEVVVLPVGGGGLSAGSSLALRRRLGASVRIVTVEPAGAATLDRALAAGGPAILSEISTEVQGLCPLACGVLNHEILATTIDRNALLEDEVIFAAQKRLVHAGEVVEPAGAAASAYVFEHIPEEWLTGRDADNPLRVCAVVSGGNPDPAQLAALRAAP
ncbi:MAG: threonine dehydratase [Chlamydiales bacterium]|jgi:threonine dehydratase